MERYRTYLRPSLISGLVYGLGSIFGGFIAGFLNKSIDPWRFLSGDQAVRLVQGILLAFAIAAIAGVIAGFVGGLSLPVVGKRKHRTGYGLQSGIVFGVAFGLLIFPVILIVSLLAFYEVSSIPIMVFSILFGIVGLFFGFLTSLILGTWTSRRFNSRITWGGTLGFGIGGLILGAGVHKFLLSISEGQVQQGNQTWLGAGFFFFGAAGGFGLSWAYSRVGDKMADGPPLTHRLTARKWIWRMLIVGAGLMVLVLLIRPIMAAVGDMLTPVDASISPILELETIGTHWMDGIPVSDAASAEMAAIAAGSDGNLALAWVENGVLMTAVGEWSATEKRTEWSDGSPVFMLDGSNPVDPTVAVDSVGRVHVAWVDAVQDGGGTAVFAAVCENGSCSTPAAFSNQTPPACAANLAAENGHPSIAVNKEDQVMLVWENEAGVLPFATWDAGSETESAVSGCVPVPHTQNSGLPRLATSAGGTFILFSSPGGDIVNSHFNAGVWQEPADTLSSGLAPSVFVDKQDRVHAAWCDDGEVVYWQNDAVQIVASASCVSRPEVAVDEDGQVHVLWYGGLVEVSNGQIKDSSLIYESVQVDSDWTAPAIAGRAGENAQPTLTTASDGSLHMAWLAPDQLTAAAQVQYNCDDAELSELAQIMFDAGRKESYIPASDPIPYCQNQYDRIIFTPNPDPSFSEQEATLNGAFDKVADLIREAEYEVLYSTMWYDKAANNDSPGAVVAKGVGDLYIKVKANPELYPRGMTVRVLLDNPPELARGDFTGQLWVLLEDFRNAGIDKMVDEEIGWRLEVADYEGAVPHSHVKTVIIDGKTAVAAGFNMSYIHFDSDHPSGKGNDRVDMGLQLTGPVVQSTVRMFDDMWDGADQRYCNNFYPPFGIPWQTFCFDKSATADHVPEVLKYYLPGADSTAFSLYRSKVHDAADVQTVEAIAAAQESVDIIQVMLTLDLICNLNIVFDVCNSVVSPDYVGALFEAAENGAKIRIIVKPSPTEGIENNVALSAMEKDIAAAGLADRFEVRYYEDDMHHKVALIDDQLLIVGSQNLHYSAYGEGAGLNEYSFAVEDPQAVEDFSRAFEKLWELSVPR